MDGKAKASIPEAMRDRWGIERVGIAAAREAARLHRFNNVPMAVWENGQVAHISPDDFEKNLDRREAWVNAAEAAEQAGQPAPPYEDESPV